MMMMMMMIRAHILGSLYGLIRNFMTSDQASVWQRWALPAHTRANTCQSLCGWFPLCSYSAEIRAAALPWPEQSVCRDSSLCLRLLPCASKTSHQKHHLLHTQCIQTTSSISNVLFLPNSILFTFSLTQLKIWMRLYRRDKNAGWGDGWVISGGIWLHCSRNSLIPPLLCSLHCSLIHNRSHNRTRSGRSIK